MGGQRLHPDQQLAAVPQQSQAVGAQGLGRAVAQLPCQRHQLAKGGSGDANRGSRLLRPLQHVRSAGAPDLQQAGDRAQVADRQLRTAVQHRPDVAGHRVVDLAGAQPRRPQRRSSR